MTTETTKPKAEKIEKDVAMTDGRIVTFAGKRRMLKESTIGEDGSVSTRFDFVNGRTITFVIPPALLLKFAAHGAEQKIGDETAGEDDVDDMILAVEAVTERLSKGEWSARAEGGSMSGMSVLLKALVEFTGKTAEEVKVMLASASHKEKLALRAHPPIKVIVDRFEAEKASKTANVDVGGLLGRLNGVVSTEAEVAAAVVEETATPAKRKRGAE